MKENENPITRHECRTRGGDRVAAGYNPLRRTNNGYGIFPRVYATRAPFEAVRKTVRESAAERPLISLRFFFFFFNAEFIKTVKRNRFGSEFLITSTYNARETRPERYINFDETRLCAVFQNSSRQTAGTRNGPVRIRISVGIYFDFSIGPLRAANSTRV